MSNYYLRVTILFLFVLIEVLSSTFWMDTLPIASCRWLYLSSGLCIAFYLLFRPIEQAKQVVIASYRWIPLVFFIVLICWIVPGFYTMYIQNPLDYTQADMLPVMQVMCTRWLNAETVYAVIPDFWNGTFPIYLPAMWMPFIPAVFFNFDLRWITLICVGVGLLAILLLKKNSKPISWLFFILIGLWFDYILHNRSETFRLSQEGVVYSYLLCLVLALYLEHWAWIGIMLVLCLLSRYAVVFFIPAMMYCLWRKYGKSYSIKLGWVAVLFGSFLMTISGAWSNFKNFITLPNQYLNNIDQFKAKYQVVLDEGLGIVPFFDIDLTASILKWMIVLLILIACIMIRYYTKDAHRFYFLAFFKLTLVVFYNLMIIPYQYLTYTSVIVSMALFYLYANHDEKQFLNLVA